MKAKLLTLRHWKDVFFKAYRLLRSPQVPLLAKLLLVVPVLLYWVLPDVMPFVPLDDMAVTLAVVSWFVSAMERRYPIKAVDEQE